MNWICAIFLLLVNQGCRKLIHIYIYIPFYYTLHKPGANLQAYIMHFSLVYLSTACNLFKNGVIAKLTLYMLLYSHVLHCPALGYHHQPQFCCNHHQRRYKWLLCKVSHAYGVCVVSLLVNHMKGFPPKYCNSCVVFMCVSVVDLFVQLILGSKLSGGTQLPNVQILNFLLCIQASKRWVAWWYLLIVGIFQQ